MMNGTSLLLIVIMFFQVSCSDNFSVRVSGGNQAIDFGSLGTLSVSVQPGAVYGDPSSQTISWDDGNASEQGTYSLIISQDESCQEQVFSKSGLTARSYPMPDLEEGDYYLCVYQEESSDSVALASNIKGVPFSVDKTPPTISSESDLFMRNQSFSPRLSVSDRSNVSVQWILPAGISIDDPESLTPTLQADSEGSYEIFLKVTDAAGHVQSHSLVLVWDTTAPTVSFGADSLVRDVPFELNLDADEDLSSYQWQVVSKPDASQIDINELSSGRFQFSADLDGVYVLRFSGVDQAGNTQTKELTVIWSSEPTVTIANQPTGFNNETSASLIISGMAISSYQYKLISLNSDTCANNLGYSAEIGVATPISLDLTGISDGDIDVCVIGRNSLGIWQDISNATTVSWVKDTLAPVAQATGYPSGTSSTTSVSANVSGTGVHLYRFKIRDNTEAACSDISGYSSATAQATPISMDLLTKADGVVELCLLGIDLAGNQQSLGTVTSYSWTKDTTAPTVTISGTPSGSSNQTITNITMSGADVAQYRYKFRQSTDLACSDSSGYSSAIPVATSVGDDISGLADGTLEICAVGIDAVGNQQAFSSASQATWVKDTVAPVAALSGTPSGTNNETTLNISISGADVAEYQYKIRSSGDPACTVSTGYSSSRSSAIGISDDISALGDGILEVCVVGIDDSGNQQTYATASSGTWTKDTTAPTATISGAPTGTNTTTVLSVTVAGSDVSSYRYKIRSSSDAACSDDSGYSAATAVANMITTDISGIADGLLELCVVGQDSSTNEQALSSATSTTWTKDTEAPTAIIGSAPSGTSSATTLNIAISGAQVLQYQYKIRLSSDLPCSDITHYSSAISVATSITDDISGLTDGSMELCVLGIDTAGNVQDTSTASTASWTKDTTAGTAMQSGAPSGESNATTLNVSISGADVSSYRYKIRTTGDSACTSSDSYSSSIPQGTAISDDISGLADGAIELCVIGLDSIGNQQSFASATSTSWTKDTLAPTASISGNPTGSSNTTSLSLTIGGSGVVFYRYKIRDSSDSNCTDMGDYSTGQAVATAIADSIAAKSDGTIEVCVIGSDAAGNEQALASATTVSWTKDTTAPTAVITGAPTGTNNTTALSVSISGSDVSQYRYKLRESTDSACSVDTGYSSLTGVATTITEDYSSMSDGSIELCVLGSDALGNEQALGAASSVTWTKDTSAPVATLSLVPTGTNNTTSLNIAVSGADVVSYRYKVKDTSGTSCTNSSGYSSVAAVASNITDDISSLSDGAIEICVVGIDATGNQQSYSSPTSSSWVKDTTAPTAAITGAPSGTNNSTSLSVSISGSDVASYRYKVRESADLACSDASNYSSVTGIATAITTSLAAVGDGALELCVLGIDAVGNEQSLSSASIAAWTKDTSPPVATISGAPSGSSTDSTLDVTIAGTDVAQYRYKIREPADSACSDSSNYSSAIAIASHITDDISGLADGAIEICVVGIDSASNQQAFSSATTTSWTKYTAATSYALGQPSSLRFTAYDSSGELNWESGDPSTDRYLLIRSTAANSDFVPINSTSYSAGYSIGNSTVIYEGTDNTFTDSSLTNGTSYYYQVYALNSATEYSQATTTSGTPSAAAVAYTYYRLRVPSLVGTCGGYATAEIDYLEFFINGQWRENAITSANTGTIGHYNVVISESSSSPDPGFEMYRAFDSNDNLAWAPNNYIYDNSSPFDETETTWLEVQFTDGPVVVDGLAILGGLPSWESCSPDHFYLEGSNDQSSWTQITGSEKTSTDTSNLYRYMFDSSDLEAPMNPKAYTYSSASRITWDENQDTAVGYLLVRKDQILSFSPSDGISYSTSTVSGHELINVGSDTELYDTGLSNGTNYYYAIYAYDSSNNYSSPTFITVQPTALTQYPYYRVSAASTLGNSTAPEIASVVFQIDGVWDSPYNFSSATGTIGGDTVTVTHSSQFNSSYAGWKIFQSGTSWSSNTNFTCSAGNCTGYEYVQLDFGANPKAITGYKILGPGSTGPLWARNPDHYYLEYSVDGISWTKIDASESYVPPIDELSYQW